MWSVPQQFKQQCRFVCIAKILFVQMFAPLMLFRKMNLVLSTQQIPKDVLAVPIVLWHVRLVFLKKWKSTI
ncbi:hypothetical protein D3C86_2155520 [compost metagenome]